MEKTIEALKTLLKVEKKVAEAFADGKVSLGEALGISVSAIGLIGVIQNLPEIGAELKTANENDCNGLIETFKANFDIPNEKLEVKIEAAIEALKNLYVLFIPDGSAS